MILDNVKKSPDWAFSIVIAIDGNTELAATLVPVCPVKKLWVKLTAFCDKPEAIKPPALAPELPKLVSVLLSNSAV